MCAHPISGMKISGSLHMRHVVIGLAALCACWLRAASCLLCGSALGVTVQSIAGVRIRDHQDRSARACGRRDRVSCRGGSCRLPIDRSSGARVRARQVHACGWRLERSRSRRHLLRRPRSGNPHPSDAIGARSFPALALSRFDPLAVKPEIVSLHRCDPVHHFDRLEP